MTIAMIIVEWLLVMAVMGWLTYRIPQVWRSCRAARLEHLRLSGERERDPATRIKHVEERSPQEKATAGGAVENPQSRNHHMTGARRRARPLVRTTM